MKGTEKMLQNKISGAQLGVGDVAKGYQRQASKWLEIVSSTDGIDETILFYVLNWSIYIFVSKKRKKNINKVLNVLMKSLKLRKP